MKLKHLAIKGQLWSQNFDSGSEKSGIDLLDPDVRVGKPALLGVREERILCQIAGRRFSYNPMIFTPSVSVCQKVELSNHHLKLCQNIC